MVSENLQFEYYCTSHSSMKDDIYLGKSPGIAHMCSAFVCDGFSGNCTMHAHGDCLSDCPGVPQTCEDAFRMVDAVDGCASDCNHSVVEDMLRDLNCANHSMLPGSGCSDKPETYCSNLCHELGGGHCDSFQCDYELGDCVDTALYCADKDPDYCKEICRDFSNGTAESGCDMFQCNATSGLCALIFTNNQFKTSQSSDLNRMSCRCSNDLHDRTCPHASCCDIHGNCLNECTPTLD